MEVRQQLVVARNRIYDGVNPGEWLTYHETDNTQPGAGAQAHANLQSSGNVRNASWHLQGDDTEIIRSFLPEVQCWHAGDGDEGPGNLTSEAYELCVNLDGDYDAALALAAAYGRDWRRRTGHGRDRIVQHNHWSGKDCPRRLRAMGPAAWAAFVASTDPEEVSTVSFVSPAQGRVTSEWGPRERHPVTGEAGFHRGIDIAPPIRGQRGVPVFACYPGTVVYVSEGVYDKLRRRWTYNEDITGGWNSGSLVVIAGDGGGNEAYGHMSGIKVRVGQRVKAGDLLGVMDEIGNVSGIHLHLEMWNGRTQGGGLKGGNTRNPRIDFKAHGVTPGSAPVLPKQGGDALTPDKNTPTPLPEDWFTMATEAQLRSIVREELQHKLQDDVVKIKHAVGRIDPGATGDTALAEPIARAVAQYTEGDTGMTLWARIARILDRSELTNHAVGRIDRTIPGIAKNVGAPLDTDQLARAVVDQITGELDQVITKAVTAAVADIPARDLEQILDAARADLKTRLEN